MKTNRERALDILVAHSRQADFIGNDQYATVNCIGIQREITAALDKAEKRGKRNEKQWWRERWQNRNKDIIQHIEQQCVPPQPEPQRYSDAEAWKLADALYSATADYVQHDCGETFRAMHTAHHRVVSAIAGQPKPQFDAEKVKEQIAILRVEAFHVGKLHEKVCGATKDEGYLSRYAALDSIHGKLLAALGIE